MTYFFEVVLVNFPNYITQFRKTKLLIVTQTHLGIKSKKQKKHEENLFYLLIYYIVHLFIMKHSIKFEGEVYIYRVSESQSNDSSFSNSSSRTNQIIMLLNSNSFYEQLCCWNVLINFLLKTNIWINISLY